MNDVADDDETHEFDALIRAKRQSVKLPVGTWLHVSVTRRYTVTFDDRKIPAFKLTDVATGDVYDSLVGSQPWAEAIDYRNSPDDAVVDRYGDRTFFVYVPAPGGKTVSLPHTEKPSAPSWWGTAIFFARSREAEVLLYAGFIHAHLDAAGSKNTKSRDDDDYRWKSVTENLRRPDGTAVDAVYTYGAGWRDDRVADVWTEEMP